MSDDLVKRLRFFGPPIQKEAADRIEELEKQNASLEAKLAKLARAAKPFASIKIKDGMSQPGEIGRTDVTNIRAALAELTGGKDE